ncbi:MAG: hypothetical protein ACKOPN_06355, partial [Prochlorococcaceae cyanobacterium]
MTSVRFTAPISEALTTFSDAVTLRKDGGRVSLEGVLTGAALGILLLYLLEDAAAAATAPSRGGPIGDAGPVDLGATTARSGAIRVAPLAEVEVGLPGGQPRGGPSQGGAEADHSRIGSATPPPTPPAATRPTGGPGET